MRTTRKFWILVAATISLASLAGIAQAQLPCFDPAVNYNVGLAPQSPMAADLDNDGDLDLAVVNGNASSVSVLRNNGNGIFAAAVNYSVGSNPISVVAADLDGDGDQDLAVANWGGANVSILLNNGNGTFATAVNYAASTLPRSIFAADFDADGDQDLAVANYTGNNVSVLLNNGNGTFAAAVNYTAGSWPDGVFAADLDGDLDVDLAVCSWASNSVSVLLNNGNGTFATAVNYTAGSSPLAVFAADLDADSDKDLVVVIGGGVAVLKNNGNATFAAAVSYTAGNTPQGVYVADLDGDRDPDLAVANRISGNVSVLLNNGNGTFGTAVNFTVGSQPYSVWAADLDGDGDRDLAVANQGNNNVSILKNCLAYSIDVSSLANSGAGSLRTAIDSANTLNGPATITFSVAGTIQLLTALPTISNGSGIVMLDGLSAPGATTGSPTVILDGSLLGSGSGIDITSSRNVIRCLEITKFPGSGISVRTGAARFNTLSENIFHQNTGLGIDLGNDGVTPNDPGDGDSGPNDLLNFPVFDSVFETGQDTFAVFGTASASARVELYLASEPGNLSYQPEATNHGPAYRFLAATTAAPSGNFIFTSIARPEWSFVTATATDPLGNTSEFAQNKPLTPDPVRITAYSEPLPPSDKTGSAAPQTSPAVIMIVYGPPGRTDSIGPTFNTFGTRALYDSLTDFNTGGTVDTRVAISSPDTGFYEVKYILQGPPGNYLTGIGIDGHAEVHQSITLAGVGQAASVTFHLAPPSRGELTGDGAVDVFDVIASIDIIFGGAPMPNPPEIVDVNCDTVTDVFDVIYMIDYAFAGGTAPCQ